MTAAFLVLAAFLASAVEMVEALTIVLASGITRGWRSSLVGVGAAVLALAVIVAALGPALTIVPLKALRLVVGALLLAFGLQWLRKAILRASGYKALHDEQEAFAHELEAARLAGRDERAGSTQGSIPLAALGAGAAVVLVATVGVLVRAPLARVPENAMKFAVGIMLTSFGIFWSAEGAGADWPGGDAALLGVIAFVIAMSFGFVAQLRRRRRYKVALAGVDS